MSFSRHCWWLNYLMMPANKVYPTGDYGSYQNLTLSTFLCFQFKTKMICIQAILILVNRSLFIFSSSLWHLFIYSMYKERVHLDYRKMVYHFIPSFRTVNRNFSLYIIITVNQICICINMWISLCFCNYLIVYVQR